MEGVSDNERTWVAEKEERNWSCPGNEVEWSRRKKKGWSEMAQLQRGRE